MYSLLVENCVNYKTLIVLYYDEKHENVCIKIHFHNKYSKNFEKYSIWSILFIIVEYTIYMTRVYL